MKRSEVLFEIWWERNKERCLVGKQYARKIFLGAIDTMIADMQEELQIRETLEQGIIHLNLKKAS